MVSLAQLCSRLGSSLQPAAGGTVPGRQLSGVHISELEDPTPYLEGGELLLTTGIPLRGAAGGSRQPGPAGPLNQANTAAYVRRLAERGVAALGLGLGEGLDEVPEALAGACRAERLELLVVPDGVPFMDVSRAYWDLAAQSGQADLVAGLGTQTALARSALRPDALPAVVKGLAQALGGWAAYLPADGGPETFWPGSVAALVPELRQETVRLNQAGAPAAATFGLHGGAVVEYPILVGRRIEGFLAIGAGRTLAKADRQIILTVCVLLSLKAQQRQELAGTSAALGAAVAKLVLRGHAEAARLLAADTGLGPLAERVRVLAVRGGSPERLGALAGLVPALAAQEELPGLAEQLAACVFRLAEDGLAWFLLPADPAPGSGPGTAADNLAQPWQEWGWDQDGWEQGDAGSVPAKPGAAVVPGPPPAAPARPADDGAGLPGAALTEPLALADVAGRAAALRQAALQAPAGELVGTGGGAEARADGWVDRLAAYSRADLPGTVAAYLRHRGHWEEAARELQVHRNSLRHRMAVAGRLAGLDLDDPDTAAHLWLALRRRGL
ncbi:PucR family transcriptional regulator [Arthrobacter mobilis]|uniref:PucR family transcriptional regulator n=1 Tax=Arthrobacter mobilis TaxID=2724944 RepID=A0A7X6K6L3_9MICC|nr:PucR family transcriptional regulator [Arthrobacter mobilis]NKX55178.1 PucR family transcriptional regulator [Arthrobacter mobilis]